MLPEDLKNNLHLLSRADKLRAVQLLINDLALDEGDGLAAGAQYKVWSPQITPEAAGILHDVLNEARRKADTDKHE